MAFLARLGSRLWSIAWYRVHRPDRVTATPRTWIRRPSDLSDREVCLFVTYNPEGALSDHALFHAVAWANQGFAVVLIVVVDDMSSPPTIDAPDAIEGVLLRANAGYDFGAWSNAITDLASIRSAGLLAIVNDSVYGPLSGFPEMLDKVRRNDADVLGAVYSEEVSPHFQSFMLFFKRRALRSRAFKRFWSNIRSGDRWFAIRKYELRLRRYFQRRFLTTGSLYSAVEGDNPTLAGWRKLVQDGFPFIKVQLLRDNPLNSDLSGWRTTMVTRGYDPDMVLRHLKLTDEQLP